jgi:hypothetical protein
MMSHDVEARNILGVDRIMWGADYPHHEGLYPHTRLGFRALFGDVPEDEVRMMTSENAAELYGFDLDALQLIADQIGPTRQDLARPVTLEEFPPLSVSITISEAKARLSG